MSVQVGVIEKAGSKAVKVMKRVEEIVGDGFAVTKFVENFDVLVNVAGSAKHLKELVLNLAVSGGLSSADDETADALFSALRRERLSLAKTGIRIGENSPPVTDEEAPYAVPAGWRWIRLRDLGGFLGGGTPAKSNSAFWKGPLPWVSPKDMKRPYIDDAEDHISTAAVEGSAVKLIPAQSVLYVVRGMILAHSFPVAVTTREVTINQDMKALVLAMPELSEFILRSCQAARTRVLAKVERSSHGTCRLESEAVEMLPIALPPLGEQKRIVARVDQLMALIDDLEARQTKKGEINARFTKASLEALTIAEGPEEFDAAWKRVVENLPTVIDRAEKVAELRSSILNLAFAGRLVRSTRGDEPATEYLQRVLGIHVGHDSGQESNPGWLTRTIGTVFEVGTGSTPTRTDPAYWSGGSIPWVTSTSTSFETIAAGNDHVTPAAVKEFRLKLFTTGSLVIALYGQGKTRGQVSELLIDACVNQACAVIRLPLREAALRKFMLFHFKQQYAALRELAEGGAQPNLNVGKIKESKISFPPRQEMERIVAKVEHLMKLCDDLEAKLHRAEDRASKLVEAVVQEMVA